MLLAIIFLGYFEKNLSLCKLLLFVFIFLSLLSKIFSRTLEKLVPKIVSYRIFFENTEKETANQTVELISNKNKKFWNKN
jgi:hypothetical protein